MFLRPVEVTRGYLSPLVNDRSYGVTWYELNQPACKELNNLFSPTFSLSLSLFPSLSLFFYLSLSLSFHPSLSLSSFSSLLLFHFSFSLCFFLSSTTLQVLGHIELYGMY